MGKYDLKYNQWIENISPIKVEDKSITSYCIWVYTDKGNIHNYSEYKRWSDIYRNEQITHYMIIPTPDKPNEI